jgi:hypothetical protein
MKRKPRSRTRGGRGSISLATRWDHATLQRVEDGILGQAQQERAADQDQGQGCSAAGKHGDVAECAQRSQLASRRLGSVFLSWPLRSGLRIPWRSADGIEARAERELSRDPAQGVRPAPRPSAKVVLLRLHYFDKNILIFFCIYNKINLIISHS